MAEHLETLDEGQRRASDALLDQLTLTATVLGRALKTRVDVMGIRDALDDPKLWADATKAVLLAASSIQDGANEAGCECFGCTSTWSRERRPRAFGSIEWPEAEQRISILLCVACCLDPGPRAAVLRGLAREFECDPATAVDIPVKPTSSGDDHG